ncbi:penicillin-binding protein 1C [Amphiplicatus metriothermophilus]|uniref:peptidoglycan glycosyltransferase n=1 Tax=Amphiplicatus metriothermophilus TaxID=1519374 RepID=A0A239PQB7_9PROT|nr:penicillin-binding protein 1C [Amphiplicatus metriothermophilus]MBB5518598.1 penicillin-binding protein 1C [Amphiplicatus metriothermophilus]SNT72243.1 penicillin-binding protein 1C [Amphiplicatus metriothermophilus]
MKTARRLFRSHFAPVMRIAAAALALLGAVAAADLLFPPPLHKGEALSPLVLDREGRWLQAFTTADGRWRFRADLDAVDPSFVERLIAVEDKRFHAHWGVDPIALARASGEALRAGRIASGASTITMQTARLLEPRPRTVGAKLVEVIRALQIERRLTKREILELYLTLAPYGGNIEGVRAASLLYFGKEPAHLTDAEQALLIALPQAPEARRPDRRPDSARAARAAILEKLAAQGLLSPARAEEARLASLPETRRPFPRAAWHAAAALAKEGAPVVRSTIDLVLQREAEALVAAWAAGLDDGATAAALIVETETRAVRAAVGSSGLDAPGGWIDLTAAVRSPGSTLKPFIYALAFDDGLIGPHTVIEDMPQSFDGYAPENFDRRFHGEVRAGEALKHSLNLPAVRLLDRLGANRLAAVLRAAGAALAAPESAEGDFGLALALGGAGVTMRDLAALYAGLADEGRARPLAWKAEEAEAPAAPAYRLFSAQSAARVSAVLADAPALEGRAPAALTVRAPKIAMKTGTSYGYRDAWAAGHAGGYTVVVWVGRADGAPRPGATGRKAAAPLLAALFDMIWRADPAAARAVPEIGESESPALARLAAPRRERAPEIVFPRDGAELFAATDEARGFSLAARGGAGGYRWYVSGEPAATEPTSGRALWRPRAAGFYEIVVVDGAGRSARAKVRVLTEG